jgi:hypothetical protein
MSAPGWAMTALLEAVTGDPVWAFRWVHTNNPRFLHQLSCVSIPADRRDYELMRGLPPVSMRCCPNERRNMNGGCDSCGDPCL